MRAGGDGPWIPFSFLGLSKELSDEQRSKAFILPVPYDSTTSYRGGARDGPRAIIEASYNLEEYDPELDTDISKMGVHTCPFLEPHMGGPQAMVERVYGAVKALARTDRLVTLIGGEHSLSTGSVKAHKELYPDLSVLYLDAHADLRDQYMGTGWGHASVARRIHQLCPLVLVGARSLSQEERDFIVERGVNTFFWPLSESMETLASSVIELLSTHVYISIDLDVFDPSIMAAVGTPEPGGIGWQQLTSLLKKVGEEKRIIGFDVMELSPREGPNACSYTAAKLVYKLLGYALGQSQVETGIA